MQGNPIQIPSDARESLRFSMFSLRNSSLAVCTFELLFITLLKNKIMVFFSVIMGNWLFIKVLPFLITSFDCFAFAPLSDLFKYLHQNLSFLKTFS